MAAAIDSFMNHMVGLNAPYVHAVAVTPDDANDLTYVTRAVNIKVAGNLQVTMAGDAAGTSVTLAVGVGTIELRVSRIWATSTTATGHLGALVKP